MKPAHEHAPISMNRNYEVELEIDAGRRNMYRLRQP
jgi:hypothetical protein